MPLLIPFSNPTYRSLWLEFSGQLEHSMSPKAGYERRSLVGVGLPGSDSVASLMFTLSASLVPELPASEWYFVLAFPWDTQRRSPDASRSGIRPKSLVASRFQF
ncbi:MAG: hypothetical protein OXH99_09665 [Bryobacterales bacterium]|nr:hypothetical protein [Bryobacterales bacterium]